MTAEPSERKPTLSGRFLYCMVMMSCRQAPPEFRFASSTLRNSVPPGAAHEAAAGHAPAEPADNLQQWLLLDFYPAFGYGLIFITTCFMRLWNFCLSC